MRREGAALSQFHDLCFGSPRRRLAIGVLQRHPDPARDMPAMCTCLSGRKRFLSDEPIQLMVDPLGLSRRVAFFLVQHCVLLRLRWRHSFMGGGTMFPEGEGSLEAIGVALAIWIAS